MEAPQIKTFIDAMAASDLQELEVSHEGWTLRLVRGGAAARAEPVPARGPFSASPSDEAAPAAKTPSGPEAVRAPMFGVVHLHQGPGQPAFVKVGDVIEAGRMICTIEAMKVFNEVRAECAGRVAAVLVPSGTEVEAGQPLVTIERVEHV
ncbi:MAG TPA: acetyl-CoA carboxylase biotin carboxyl carrier protein subunit [Ramlibacter sp.]|uniref:acetyl-CoA carboxylase biotin carboxyl carrier protein n=1 Tax=Ramlibacter sp. TaxID=1917967 RepID=UPI002ED44031